MTEQTWLVQSVFTGINLSNNRLLSNFIPRQGEVSFQSRSQDEVLVSLVPSHRPCYPIVPEMIDRNYMYIMSILVAYVNHDWYQCLVGTLLKQAYTS